MISNGSELFCRLYVGKKQRKPLKDTSKKVVFRKGEDLQLSSETFHRYFARIFVIFNEPFKISRIWEELCLGSAINRLLMIMISETIISLFRFSLVSCAIFKLY